MQKNLTFRNWAPYAMAVDNSKRGYRALQSCKAFCISLKQEINNHITICHQLTILPSTRNYLLSTLYKSSLILTNNKSMLMSTASFIQPATTCTTFCTTIQIWITKRAISRFASFHIITAKSINQSSLNKQQRQ